MRLFAVGYVAHFGDGFESIPVGADPCVRPNAFTIHAFPVCYRADTWVRPYDG